jgi:hypothetical protein
MRIPSEMSALSLCCETTDNARIRKCECALPYMKMAFIPSFLTTSNKLFIVTCTLAEIMC